MRQAAGSVNGAIEDWKDKARVDPLRVFNGLAELQVTPSVSNSVSHSMMIAMDPEY